MGNVRLVGKQLAIFLGDLMDKFGTNMAQQTHIIGYSLGAQIAGTAGMYFKSEVNNTKLHRITALDAAGPMFEKEHKKLRLDPTDAQYVDAIHTAAKSVIVAGRGIVRPIGHVDFYPNGGSNQPGCRKSGWSLPWKPSKMWDQVGKRRSCSHYRAIQLYTETISEKVEALGFRCNSMEDYTAGKCFDFKMRQNLGYDWKEQNGTTGQSYFLKTRDKAPFLGILQK